MLSHYLDNFVAIFKAKEATQEKMSAKKKAYIQLTDLLGVSRNDSKDAQGTAIIVFCIEIDTSCFTASLSKEKHEKATRATAKILSQSQLTLSTFNHL